MSASAQIQQVVCLVLLAAAAVTQAQDVSCASIETFPLTFLNVQTENCATDRSSCADDVSCDCIDGDTGVGEGASALCYDGCEYFYDETQPPVIRTTFGAASKAATTLGSSAQTISTRVGFEHSFPEESGSSGSLSYFYTPDPANIRAPAIDSTCQASWNGQACNCFQKWCEVTVGEQEYYSNVLDCTGAGGGVLDLCLDIPTIDDQSSKMEILFWVPLLVCEDTSFLPSLTTRDYVGGNDAGSGNVGGGDSNSGSDSSSLPNGDSNNLEDNTSGAAASPIPFLLLCVLGTIISGCGVY